MKTLYVSDLDGTLLNSDSRIPADAVATLNHAISLGAQFTVATARTTATVAGILKDLTLPLPAIIMTGATTWNRALNSYSDTHHFPPLLAREILSIYSAHHLPTFLYTLRSDMINVYHLGPLSEVEKDFIRSRADSPYKHFHLSPLQKESFTRTLTPEEESRVWEESRSLMPEKISDGVLFFAMQKEERGRPVYEELLGIEHINPIFYNDTVYVGNAMIEAFPAAASKANAIKKLARQIGADRIVVFGDNRNDMPMFRIADLSVAVSNAIPEVKKMADIIIGDCNDGSVAKFILEDYEKNHSL